MARPPIQSLPLGVPEPHKTRPLRALPQTPGIARPAPHLLTPRHCPTGAQPLTSRCARGLCGCGGASPSSTSSQALVQTGRQGSAQLRKALPAGRLPHFRLPHSLGALLPATPAGAGLALWGLNPPPTTSALHGFWQPAPPGQAEGHLRLSRSPGQPLCNQPRPAIRFFLLLADLGPHLNGGPDPPPTIKPSHNQQLAGDRRPGGRAGWWGGSCSQNVQPSAGQESPGRWGWRRSRFLGRGWWLLPQVP